jgi:glycine cleavage system protein P-like pyridoxal-binding family
LAGIEKVVPTFADAIDVILTESPDVLKSAPHNTAVSRVDEVLAARNPILSWRMWQEQKKAGGEKPQ